MQIDLSDSELIRVDARHYDALSAAMGEPSREDLEIENLELQAENEELKEHLMLLAGYVSSRSCILEDIRLLSLSREKLNQATLLGLGDAPRSEEVCWCSTCSREREDRLEQKSKHNI